MSEQLAAAAATTTHLRGVHAQPCRVQVTLSPGLPTMDVEGLHPAVVREVRVRVRAAISAASCSFPTGGIHVAVVPAGQRDGTSFDLPIALAILAAAGQVPKALLERTTVLGELSLTGQVRPVRGALAAAEAARAHGSTAILVAVENAAEAALAGIPVRAVGRLRHAIDWLNGDDTAAPLLTPAPVLTASDAPLPDMADIRGQPFARRALEVAAAGGHHLLLIGGPGAGKTMFARRLPGLLPPLTTAESLATTRVASAAGLNIAGGAITRRPFRAPHHSTTAQGLVGGGAHPRPGELSLAHNGVLFLDELPEFQRQTLEVLAQPLTMKEVQLVRADGTVSYPAAAQIVAAMNPCPCGHAGHVARRCRCTREHIDRYHQRLPTALLGAFDLCIDVPPVDLGTLVEPTPGESSAVIAARVAQARLAQVQRQGKNNAELTAAELRLHARPDEAASTLLTRAIERLHLDPDAHARVLRIARTIADLETAEHVAVAHVAEALQCAHRGQRGCQPRC